MAARFVVLGGGVSGLSAAYFLARGLAARSIPYKITLLEKEKLGGWMQTHTTENSIFELGPRSIRATGFPALHTLKLVDDLELEDEIIEVVAQEPTSRNRFIYVDGQLRLLPNSISSLFKATPPLTSSLASIYFKSFYKKIPEGAETMYDVISSKFGEEVAKYHLDAFARGVFAADVRELSLKAAFPDLWAKYKPANATVARRPKLFESSMNMSDFRSNKLITQARSEKWVQWSMQGGLSKLVDGLKRGCEEYKVNIVDAMVTGLTLKENGKFCVEADLKETEDDENYLNSLNSLDDIDQVISTLPAHDLSKVLLNESSEDKESLQKVGSKLEGIKSVDVGVVNLEFKGRPGDILPETGFGHLVPSCEDSKVLGIVYDSCVFKEHDRKDFPATRLTCMMGGSWFELLFGDPEQVKDHDLEQAALESVADQLGITSDPTTVVTKLCRQCIPLYRTGHTDLVESIEDILLDEKIPLSLCGSSFWGVSVNDCIYNSRAIVEEIIAIKYHKTESQEKSKKKGIFGS